MTETVAGFHRVLARGSSFPSLVETSSAAAGHELVRAGQGEAWDCDELIAAILPARGLNVRAPSRSCRRRPALAGRNDEFYEAVQRSVGWNLGVEFIRRAVDLEAVDLPSLPADFLSRLVCRRRAAAERRSHRGQPERAARRGRSLRRSTSALPADRSAGARASRRGSICPPTTSWPVACARNVAEEIVTGIDEGSSTASSRSCRPGSGKQGLSRQDLAGDRRSISEHPPHVSGCGSRSRCSYRTEAIVAKKWASEDLACVDGGTGGKSRG